MAIYSAKDTIFLRKGDSGNIVINGLPTDKNYTVYLSVVDENEQIIKEWYKDTNKNTTVTFSLSASDTDSIPVNDYTYGIKICNNGQEDTLIPRTNIENGKIKQYPAPAFIVGEKYVEGAE